MTARLVGEVRRDGDLEVVRLRDWSVVFAGDCDVYQAPEARLQCLHGVVEGHSNHRDGTQVQTSVIATVDARRREVRTTSGRVYELVGPPAAEYARWLDGHPLRRGAGELSRLVDAARGKAPAGLERGSMSL